MSTGTFKQYPTKGTGLGVEREVGVGLAGGGVKKTLPKDFDEISFSSDFPELVGFIIPPKLINA